MNMQVMKKEFEQSAGEQAIRKIRQQEQNICQTRQALKDEQARNQQGCTL